MYTLWTLLRNYRTKQRSRPVNSTVISRYAQHIVKYIIQRLVYATDRLFLTAPTSGIVIPVPLANAIFNLLSHCRKKCTGLWRNYGTEKSVLMGLGKEITLCYQALNESGIVSTTLAAFLKLSFPTVSIQNLFEPMFQSCNGNEDIFPDISVQGSSIRRPHHGLFGDVFPIPDPLIREVSENSFKKFSTANISELLQNPQEILDMDPFDPRIGGFPLNKKKATSSDQNLVSFAHLKTDTANSSTNNLHVPEASDKIFSPPYIPFVSNDCNNFAPIADQRDIVSLSSLVKNNFPQKRKRKSRNIDPNMPRRPRGRPKGSKTKRPQICSSTLFQPHSSTPEVLSTATPEVLPIVQSSIPSNLQSFQASSLAMLENEIPIASEESDDTILASILQDLYDLPSPPPLLSLENENIPMEQTSDSVELEDIGLTFPICLQDLVTDE
uniref:Uncharacterized protein n=1 Tax=Saimiriine herpesvirus 2 TaxID=10381 RepID=Q80BH6_SHV2|nr:hypothetical protein [Saimiriine gammaherpesvirus 2]